MSDLRRTALDEVAGFCRDGGAIVLTGAGVSTDSGIPDYRSPGRVMRTPMQHAEFVGSAAARARYWLRSAHGWPRFCAAQPNPTHDALAALQQGGALGAIITQNVDGLHQRAGARDVRELHGSLHAVECLGCGARCERAAIQRELIARNPWLGDASGELRPDGDVEVDGALAARLDVPACDRCGGVLKPAVVFFGGNVAPALVAACRELVGAARVLVVIGSSLTVFSGYRFALHARDHGVPIAIVNRGPTRAEALARWRFDAGAAEITTALRARVASASG